MVARRYTSKVRGLAIAEKSIFSEEVACPTGIEPVTYSLEVTNGYDLETLTGIGFARFMLLL